MHANIGMENFGVEYCLRGMQWIIYRQSYFHLEVSSFVGSLLYPEYWSQNLARWQKSDGSRLDLGGNRLLIGSLSILLVSLRILGLGPSIDLIYLSLLMQELITSYWLRFTIFRIALVWSKFRQAVHNNFNCTFIQFGPECPCLQTPKKTCLSSRYCSESQPKSETVSPWAPRS